jgi:putative Mn2+ efflux pump MntP
MSYVELLLLGISLCFDTFAVSLTGGICMGIKLNIWQTLKIILTFALFQMGLTMVGWLLGTGFYVYIERIDHWIAFGLLIYIGGGMLLEGFRGKEESECQECGKSKTNLLNPKTLCVLAVATSIDALAVGISLAMVSLSFLKLIIGMSSIFLFTALASYIGLNGGRAMGDKLGSKPEMVGGLILVGIGVKILLEHLVF